jgi:hypothetical protein
MGARKKEGRNLAGHDGLKILLNNDPEMHFM